MGYTIMPEGYDYWKGHYKRQSGDRVTKGAYARQARRFWSAVTMSALKALKLPQQVTAVSYRYLREGSEAALLR